MVMAREGRRFLKTLSFKSTLLPASSNLVIQTFQSKANRKLFCAVIIKAQPYNLAGTARAWMD